MDIKDDFEKFIKDWNDNKNRDDYTISLVPKKEYRKDVTFSKDWQTNEICERYCTIEDILQKYSVANPEDLNTRLDKADMFDYLMNFINNIDNVQGSDKIYCFSFVNNTPWLNCARIDEEHFIRLRKYNLEKIKYTPRNFPYINIVDKYGSVIRVQQSSANLGDVWLFNDQPAIEDKSILLTEENLKEIIEFKKKIGA